MSTSPPTAVGQKQALAESLYDGDLRAFVAEKQGERVSWRGIAQLVNEGLPAPLTVSHEALRLWYGDQS